MSLGIAVMFYQIPGLVGTTFGNHKGLFSAYVDGVAYGMASFVWKIVASTVSHDAAGAGWAYGWAAVALLLVLCAILMPISSVALIVHTMYGIKRSGGAELAR